MKPYVALFICLLSLTARGAAAAPAAEGAAAPAGASGARTASASRRSGTGRAADQYPPGCVGHRSDGAGAAQPKSLMVMLVDRAMGRTRAAFQDRSIAVDARPTIVDGRIRV